MKSQLRVIGALALSLAVFIVDAFTTVNGAIAVVYIAAILLIAPMGIRAIITAAIAAIAFTLLAFVLQHGQQFNSGALLRLFVCIVAISLTTVLILRDRATRTSLVEQARILELSHDTVIIRDKDDVIVYWNDGAEKLYGWMRSEAVGKHCESLLKCQFSSEEVQAAFDLEGHWTGELIRTRRDGASLTLASRWLQRKDAAGHPVGVIESSADVTAQLQHDAARRASEQRYRTIFETAGFATWESNWLDSKRVLDQYTGDVSQFEDWLLANPKITQAAIQGAIIRNANPAAVRLFHAESSETLSGTNLCGRYLPESFPAIAQLLATLHRGERGAENEVRLRTLEGEVVDVVLRVNILPDSHDWSHVLVMAFDVTERNVSRARIEQTSAELAHAARVSLLGQLSASITHEVNQPLTAILNYARSGERWLSREEPDLIEVSSSLQRIVTNGNRAAEVIKRVKTLAKKAVTPAASFSLPEIVDDALELVRYEAKIQGVKLKQSADGALPLAFGDRVQVQQVLVNLIVNGLQAMRDVTDRKKELRICVGVEPEGMLRVEVRDAGMGFAQEAIGKVFDPFFTTKAEGMGMGLSICRTIVEAQGGHILVSNNEGPGATVTFTVPVTPAST
ncbi:PAS domain-containing sensor histidine kinase [Dyella humicola]|uniref:PAS domain-containing sensor histidine kinase n=1 Tax=Dyella humicola TaxID=2992126 RepID=UPI002259D4B2|nr:PAS domain-containing sensor histidine kinase [Dyella humicola]